jgi:hypothetical protein
VPYATRMVPSRRTGRWTALAVAAGAAPWLAFVSWLSFASRAAEGRASADPLYLLGVTLAVTVVVWSLLASLRTPRLPWSEVVTVVGAGVAATLVWSPALVLTAGLIPLAMSMLVAGFIPLAIVPLLFWGSFCCALAFSRIAVGRLMSSSDAE